MEYRSLGNTGIKVSRLCFGSLTLSPLQANLPVREGSTVIRDALEKGVNFIDTSHYYDNYEYIKQAISGSFRDTVVASKSYDYTYRGMRDTFFDCLRAIERDYVDIFLLHEQESSFTIKGHWEALEFLIKAKEEGLVRATGISTHNVAGTRAAALIPEIDVIHPIINKAGIGIKDGSVEDMLESIDLAYTLGKGLYGMKALGGGNLIEESIGSLRYALNVDELASIAVGMQSIEEVNFNVEFFSGKLPELSNLKKKKRYLHIEEWCTGCGQCVEFCSAGALAVLDGKASVSPELCRLCGYCGAACPDFCIKIL